MAVDRRMTVAVLYDTSYLMNGGRPAFAPTPIVGLDVKRNRDYIIRAVRITHILAEEVKREIHGHFGDADKIQASRSARKTVAELIALGTRDASQQCREVLLADVAAEYSCGDVLGADSRTDRLLVGHARQLAASGTYDCVCIATEDGGVMVDVNRLRVQQQLNLHCIPARDADISALVLSTSPEARREYKLYAIDLPGLLWKKLFG